MNPIQSAFLCLLFSTVALAATAAPAEPPVPIWKHLSSRTGDLPSPNGGTQQTTAAVFDIDGDGIADIVIGERTQAPSLIWLRRQANGWAKYVIDDTFQTPEAGGAAWDVDGDGDLDLIVGGDYRSNELWWYENPTPNFDPQVPWKRHLIKKGFGTMHHDQVVADFKGTGRPQVMFWNQGAKKLFMAEPPANPRTSDAWTVTEIIDTSKVTTAIKQEGMAVADIDGDGKPDLVAGIYWFKHVAGNEFKAIPFTSHPGRVAAGKFKPGKYPQIILSSGDGDGPLMMFSCEGDPQEPKSWIGRDLLNTTVIHGHSLQVADINGDGHLDIFCGEMAKWSEKKTESNNPQARAWILFGDGAGNFKTTLFATGIGFHEVRVADFDGDGRLDILNKPYNWDTPRVDVWLNQGNGRTTSGTFSGPLGMELWTYRRELKQDLPGTLAMIRKQGFTDVETSGFYGQTAIQFRETLQQAGLTCSSLIATYEALAANIDAVIADAQAVGAHYVVTANIPRKGQLTMEECARAAADFNRWGAALRQHGLRFGYHPHGFEFVRTQDGTLFDALVRLTQADLVTFELDVFWFAHGGTDPAACLERYPDRFELVHLKDMRKGTPVGLTTGRAPNEASVALGEGELDFTAILRAAAKVGVKRYYIEDESPAAAQQVPVTQRYLETVRY